MKAFSLLPENATHIHIFAYSVLSLSIVALWTLINFLGYLLAIN